MVLRLLIVCAVLQGLFISRSIAADNCSITYYYVKPVNASCPAEVQLSHCQTIDFYAKNLTFQSNRTFLFLNGTHTLSQDVIVENAERLSLIGVQNYENCSIICTALSGGFAFFDVTSLHISYLHIYNCGIHKQEYSPLAAAILIKGSRNASLDQLVVTNTTGGYGLVTLNTHDFLSVTNSNFSYGKNSTEWEGGNMRIIFSVCEDNEPKHVYIKGTAIHHGYEYYRVFREVGCGGLTIEISCYNVKVHIEDSQLSHNTGYFGGNIFVVFGMLTNNTLWLNNVSSTHGKTIDIGRGGGLLIFIKKNIGVQDTISCGTHSCLAATNTLLNFSKLYFYQNEMSAFVINDASYPGTKCVTQYAVIKDSVFMKNSSPLWWAGAAVRLAYSPLSQAVKKFAIIHATFKNCSFTAHFGAGHDEQFVSSVLYFEMVEKVTIEDCSIGKNNISGIQAYTSNVHFKGHVNIFRNTNYYGSGLLLLENSFMILTGDTTINFYENHAVTVGGGIFSDFNLQIPTKSPCFYQLDISGNTPAKNFINSINVNFINNTAGLAGSATFGGRIDECYTYQHSYVTHIFHDVFKINNTEEDPSAITSEPYFVCFCLHSKRLPDCTVNAHNVTLFPGENFQISATTVGSSRQGIIQGVVHSKFTKSYPNTSFGSLQAAQNSAQKYCSTFNYTIYSLEREVSYFLSTDKISFFSLYKLDSKIVHVTFLDCPPGFELHSFSGKPKCDCEKQLQTDNIQCLITGQLILPPLGSWIGYYNNSFNSNVSGALFHRYCPYSYCHSNESYVQLNDTDRQCSSNRSGILCGECQSGLSLTLGRNECAKCSNITLLFVLVFGFAGICLVVLLFFLRLTVTEGSINGLIFYANVLKMNQAFLLPKNETNFLSVFIAWMNLDLGIDLCFYDGMDSIAKTFLQFAFPVYIWLLVVLVIVLANRFRFIAELVGERAVQVLATLLLLSYTKLQRVIVTAMTYTTLSYPDNSTHYVWLYDGNVRYFHGRHTTLFAAALVCFVLFIIPYTILLTFFKIFQRCSDRKVMSWINKLKPVFDAYAGPYKDKFRFWTGFLILTRTILILALTFNWEASPDYNLFVAAMVTTILIMIVSSFGGIYKNKLYNVFETFCYFNVAALALVLLYRKEATKYAALNGSMGLAFALFVIVTCVHLLKHTPFRSCKTLLERKHLNNNNDVNRSFDDLLFDRDENASLNENGQRELVDTIAST